MNRHRALIIVSLIALVFAGLASWGVYTYLKKESAKVKSATEGSKVLVAAADLPIGTKLDPTQVKQAEWPKANIPPGALTDANAVTGRMLVRQTSAGDVITEQKLAPKEGTPGAGVMTYLVPKGHRAVTVAVNEVAGVAGFITPNNRVDVVLTVLPTGAKDPISKIIMQDIPILAIGQITEQKDGKPVVVPTVTLDMMPDNAEKLVLAASRGSLQLLLRNITDTDRIPVRGATIGKVLAGDGAVSEPVVTPAVKARPKRAAKKVAKPAQPAQTQPPPPKLYSVEMIKGTTKSTRDFAAE
jgi:pilus assembly protein CpaB